MIMRRSSVVMIKLVEIGNRMKLMIKHRNEDEDIVWFGTNLFLASGCSVGNGSAFFSQWMSSLTMVIYHAGLP